MTGRGKPLRVAEALASYLARSGLGTRLEQATALEDWPDRVGDRIAAATEPLHVSGGVLFVAVRSSAWLMELRMMEAEIRRRLNEGRDGDARIRRIRFVPADGDPGDSGRSRDAGASGGMRGPQRREKP